MRQLSVMVPVGVLAIFVLAGCGAPSGGAVPVEWETTGAESPEQAALRALGYDTGQVAADDTGQVAGNDPGQAAGDDTGHVAGDTGLEPPPRFDRWQERRQRQAVRVWLRRDALHGEAVVRTDRGTSTVLFQRGVVASLTDTSVTVESTDGFTQTWVTGTPLRVIEARQSVEPRALQPGDRVGVAGARIDGEPVARLIVIDAR